MRYEGAPKERQSRWVLDGALGAGRLRYGADYNPEQWTNDIWLEDARLMRDAGVNIVSLGIFSWAMIEPRPGEYEFAWLDEVIDIMHRNGIDVDLATATASPPPWLARLHPEILPVRADGTILSPGGRQHWRPTSPVFRRYALRLTRAIASRYGGHRAVVAWHVSNELGCHNVFDYSDDAAREFRSWLRETYTSLDALNVAWGTAFWSQRYSHWDEILPPRNAPTHLNPGQQLDFERFSSETLRRYLAAESAVLREVAPRVPITTNFMVAEVFPSIDYATWVDEVDFVSNDHYLKPGPRGRDELSFSANLTGNIAGGHPWFLMEHATSAVNWRSVNPPKRAGELRRDALTHVAHGADAVCFFQWRQSWAGGERYHSAMLPHAGEGSRVFQDVKELGATLASLAPIAGSRRVPARVAILFDWESWWVSERDSHPSDRIRYREEALDWYIALLDRGVRADVIPVTTPLDAYDVVIAPMTHVVPAARRDRLAAYVRGGGSLIATYFSGIVDQHDRVWLGGYPGALKDLLGVVVEEFVPLLEGQTATLSNGAVAKVWTERLGHTADDVEVLARYADGDLAGLPAVTHRRVGGGAAVYVSADLGVDGIGRLLPELSSRFAGLAGDPMAADGRLELARRSSGEHEYLFLINRTDSVLSCSPDLLALQGSDRVGGISVDARGVVVLAFGREDADQLAIDVPGNEQSFM